MIVDNYNIINNIIVINCLSLSKHRPVGTRDYLVAVCGLGRVLTFDYFFLFFMQELGNTHGIFVLATLLSSLLAQQAVLVVLVVPPWTAVKDGSDRQIAELLPTRAIQYSCTCAIHYCNCCSPAIVQQLFPTRAIAQISTRFVFQMFGQPKTLNAGVANRLQAT